MAALPARQPPRLALGGAAVPPAAQRAPFGAPQAQTTSFGAAAAAAPGGAFGAPGVQQPSPFGAFGQPQQPQASPFGQPQQPQGAQWEMRR